jgi:pimeloyl-ACP methyl ester carboxylesterase
MHARVGGSRIMLSAVASSFPKGGWTVPRVRAGDVELNYVEHGAGDEPLVFIHGYTGSLRDWEETLARLPAGLKGYAFDLRGAGDSDRPGSGYTIPQFAADIDAATRALGLNTFTLIGHSMGGGTAMQFAVTYPQRLRKLVLVAPVSSNGVQPMDPEFRNRMKAMRHNKELARQMAKAFMVRPRTDEQIERGIESNLKWQDDAYDGAYESMVSLRLGDRIATLDVPTLMVVGDRDFLRAVNLEDAQRIPNCALQVFYRVGHMIQQDVADEFVSVLTDFVENGVGRPFTAADRAQFMEEMVAG